jgi:hypothetical protein
MYTGIYQTHLGLRKWRNVKAEKPERMNTEGFDEAQQLEDRHRKRGEKPVDGASYVHSPISLF